MTYYFPISSSNLYLYISSALIAPACYYQDREIDAQAKNDKYLFLLKEKAIAQDTDCIIELVLTKDEESELVENISGFLLEKPLPISRIKKISFVDKEKGKTIVGNIALSTAFIPEGIIDYLTSYNEVKCEEYQLNSTITKSFEKVNISFDRLLGGLALMRIARDPEETFSENYISMISRYNSHIRKLLLNSGEYFNDKILKNNDSIKKDIEKQINKELLLEIAKAEGQENLLFPNIDLSKLKEKTRIFALIYDYALYESCGEHKIEELMINNFNRLGVDKEDLAFYYGYNKGYQKFSKKYCKADFKYSLDSKLDRYVIETIYQSIINKKEESSEFLYLDELFSDSNILEVPSGPFDYYILGTIIRKKIDISGYVYKKWDELCKSIYRQDLKGFCDGIIKEVGEIINRYVSRYKMLVCERNRLVEDYRIEISRLREEVERLTKSSDLLVVRKGELVDTKKIQKIVSKDIVVCSEKNANGNEKKDDSKTMQKSMKLSKNSEGNHLKIIPEVINISKEDKKNIG